jgi:rRNA maturation endonuclease Nob1
LMILANVGEKLNYIESLEEMKGVKLSSDSSISSERFFKKCPYCGFNNKYQAKFCKQCGKKLEKKSHYPY